MFLGGFALSLACVPWMKNLAFKYGWLDRPHGRKQHERPVPLLGGLGILLPLPILFFIVGPLLGEKTSSFLGDRSAEIMSLFAGMACILLVGLFDDRKVLSWRAKLSAQLFAVLILLAGGHCLRSATVPFLGVVHFGWFGYALFALTVILITNAINLIDGLDGVAGGICFFAALTCGIISIHQGDVPIACISLILSGGLLAFLCFNFPPASIFMGDAGSLTLGFFLGAIATSSAAVGGGAGQRSSTMSVTLIPLLPFAVALVDVALAVLRRWISGKRIFLPDANHLHHRLVAEFKHPRKVVFIIYSFTALLSVTAICLTVFGGLQSDPWGLGLALILSVGTVGAILRLYRVKYFSDAIANRTHIKFLDSFVTFEKSRAHRARSTEELLALLESGVRDLDFDSVEVFNDGTLVSKWVNPSPIHPDHPRITGEIPLGLNGYLARWSIPVHDSKDYQDTLTFSWYEFVTRVDSRLRHLEERSQKDIAEPIRRTGKVWT
jgi:UDP-GlcNAc:undecaprenyl-phosphate GlcNAc-1-phosphate transferase